MANGIGFRTNSNPEIKRNIQQVNNRNHEQRNQGIPSKPNLNFRAVHKSYSSIFVSNIPWKATVQDLWDSCNQWGVVIDVYIAAKRSKSGPEHEEPLDADNCDSVSSKDDNNDSDLSSEMPSTSRLMREVDVRGVDSDHVDSFEEGEIIRDSVLNNDGCVKDCMEKNLDDYVEKDIEDCSKNVTEKCGVNTSIPEVVEDLLLHQDKCRVRPVKATVNDSSIVSSSTPLDKGEATSAMLYERLNIMNDLTSLENNVSLELAHKAKIKWAVEEWIEEPNAVKNKLFSHFRDLFERPCKSRLTLDIESLINCPQINRIIWKDLFRWRKSKELCGDDFLDDVMANFGFGTRWRDWILSCLKSSRGSILVNGSPTLEFQFYKGLKQGDPLSPFLFILVMESLNLSLHNVVSVGLFKGVNLDNSLQKKGGLGLSSFYALNCTLTFKWIWRFRTHGSSLWSRVIKLIHGEYGKIGKSFKHGLMSNWNNITRGITLFQNKGIDLLGYIKKKTGNVANKMAHSSLASSLRRNSRSGIEQVQMANLISNLEDLTLPNMHDRWRWSLSGDGEFSVASLRNLIDDRTLVEVGAKTRWIKGLDLDTIFCPSCNSAVESSNHIFFGFPMVKDLYKFLARWWDVSMMAFFSYDEWWNWFSNLWVPSKLKLIFEGVFYISSWVIWNYRNKVIFGPGHQSKDRLTDGIVAFSFTWCRSRCKAKFSWIDWLKNPSLIPL
nr:hypothetical protein [Tanacetum cinerariifolium]